MEAHAFDIHAVRGQFPALEQEVGGKPAVFLDGPGGTQVPSRVIAAMTGYLERDNSNLGGAFRTSEQTGRVVEAARSAVADLYGALPDEIVFGANMTTLTFHLSRALARTWREGDEVVVTRLDHDANVSPWTLAARDRGAVVRWLDFDPEDCTLRLDLLGELLNERTRLVAIGYASNAVGTINDVRRVVEAARAVGALVFVDAVHLAPHRSLDVRALDCDFLVSSPYKYFGPHSGALYGRAEHLERLEAYKVRPASDEAPDKWEAGTPAFEALAGVAAAVDYLASLSSVRGSRREQLLDAQERVRRWELELARRFLEGAGAVPELRVYGLTDPGRLEQRTPTFAVELDGLAPRQLAERLGEQGIFTWDGNYYALGVIERLGLVERGGLLRIGFVHYNTPDEVDRVLAALAAQRTSRAAARAAP